MDPIKGMVAAIKDEYTVVLNIGSKDKVEEGMKFIIYSEGEEIIDPESGESLGKFENVKAKVKVLNVAENYSTARSDEYESITIDPLGLSGGILSIASLASTFSVYNKEVNKKLPLDEEAKRSFLKCDSDSLIHVKDRVRQIIS